MRANGFKALALCLALGASVAAWAQADTPEARRSAARALLATMNEVSGPERAMAASGAAMRQGLKQQLAANPRLSEAQRERALELMSAELTAAVGDMLREVMPGLQAAMEEVYVQRFTLPELQELLRFHSSEVGRKGVTVMMEDLPRLTQPMMARMQAMAPRVQERMQAAAARLKAEGIDLEAAKP